MEMSIFLMLAALTIVSILDFFEQLKINMKLDKIQDISNPINQREGTIESSPKEISAKLAPIGTANSIDNDSESIRSKMSQSTSIWEEDNLSAEEIEELYS